MLINIYNPLPRKKDTMIQTTYNPTLWFGFTPLFAFAIWGASRGIWRDIKRYKHNQILKKWRTKNG